MTPDEGQSTREEAVGLHWWNDLPPEEREFWLQACGSDRPADAWVAWQQAACRRTPDARDVRVALDMLGGTSSVAALSSELRRRHPRASGAQIHGAVQTAIRDGQIYAHEALLHTQSPVPESSPLAQRPYSIEPRG